MQAGQPSCVTKLDTQRGDLETAPPAMDLPPLRRRRARPTCSRQKVILCACLGLGARSMIPTAEAWVPAATLLQGRGTSASTIDDTTRRGGGGGNAAISHRPVFATNKGRWGHQQQQQRRRRQQGVGKTFAIAGGGGGGSGGGGWGVAAPTAAASGTAVSFSSRESAWRGRPVADALAVGSAGRRGGVGVRMSMAEEERGDNNNAVLGALAIAGFGAVYYVLHDHAAGAGGLGLGTATGAVSTYSASLESVVETAKASPSAATTAIQAFLASSVTKIEELGPLGALYFGLLYVLAEVLIIPAIPLTTAAGFLFGVAGGTAVVLTSATIAAAISFQLGRTLLREPVEGLLDENPKFRALDTAIAKEGFKVILLLRLSPIFPFALSNYLYGVTSVDFFEYMMGTLIGFFPGTLAYVYGGTLGKALTDGGGMALPWYGYAAGAVFVAFLLKTVGEIATTAIEEMEEIEP